MLQGYGDKKRALRERYAPNTLANAARFDRLPEKTNGPERSSNAKMRMKCKQYATSCKRAIRDILLWPASRSRRCLLYAAAQLAKIFQWLVKI